MDGGGSSEAASGGPGGAAVKDGTFVTIVAMACITAIALVYDGELALIAVGALVGLLAPSPLERKPQSTGPASTPGA